VSAIRDGQPINFQELRNKLVTANTKKHHPEYQELENRMNQLRSEKKNATDKQPVEEQIQQCKQVLRVVKQQLKSSKNEGVFEWETKTPKEIRAEAVKDVCKAYKTLFTNLKKGHIKRFKVGFRLKKEKQQCLSIPKSFIKNKEGKIIIAPSYFESEKDAMISMGKKTIKKYKELEIQHDCRLVKKNHQYWLFIPVDIEPPVNPPILSTYCGIDPGVRTFMTTFGNSGCYEYEHSESMIRSIDKKIQSYGQRKKPIRKRKYLKQEQRKDHVVTELHWKTIHALLSNNDILFYGDIQTHNIVRKNENRTLNRDVNNLKFYQFKQRLEFKASELGKKVLLVKEHYTTKTCSFCGTMNEPGNSKIYHCKSCNKTVGRDVNASKNILLKGMVNYKYQ
jgi:putative transposase